MGYSDTTRHALRTSVVALLCLGGAGAGAWLLFRDFGQTAGDGQGPAMAKVERREAKVRRKPSKSFAWSNAQSEEKLFRRDSVQTGVGSGAAIRFNDGTLLELGENSLVVIDDIKHLSLDFLKGSVVLHTAEGDKRVTVGKDGRARFEELPVRIVRPEPLARLFVPGREAKRVRFVWKARSGAEDALRSGVLLQVSRDRGFRGARGLAVPVKEGQVEVDVPLAAGGYFWRLSAGERPLTEVGQFRVVSAEPLKLLAPAAGENIVGFGDEVQAQFRWLAHDDAAMAAEELQVAHDPGFKSLVSRQEVVGAAGAAIVRALPAGNLFWRIVSRYGDIEVSSAVERFSVVRAQRPTLALLYPEEKRTIERSSSLRLGWTSDSQGLDYAIEIQDPTGKPVAKQRTQATAHTWLNPPAGAYRWRITAFHKEQEVGQTPWRAFSVFEGAPIALRAPAKGQEIRYWEQPATFDFEWDADALLARHPSFSYQLQLARGADFKGASLGPKSREPRMPRERMPLSPGEYFWKVLIVDESDQVIKASEPSRFVYGPYPLLPAPEAISPVHESKFDLVEREQVPVVAWTSVEGAQAYELTVYARAPGRIVASGGLPEGVPAGSRVVHRSVTTQLNFELKGLKPADYLWTVRAVDRIKRGGHSMRPRGFSVLYGAVLGPPQVLSPEVQ